MTILGPDVSRYQAHPEWRAVAADGRFKFAILKASEGLGYDPSYIEANLPAARAAGLVVGAYHFGTGSHGGAEQARYFVDVVKRANGGTCDGVLLVLDLERAASGPSMTNAQAREFITQVRALTGSKVGLYHSASGFSAVGQDWGWVAAYGPSHAPRAEKFWQYTDGKYNGTAYPKSCPGIGPCDISVFNGTIDELHALAGTQGDDMAKLDHDDKEWIVAAIEEHVTAKMPAMAKAIVAALLDGGNDPHDPFIPDSPEWNAAVKETNLKEILAAARAKSGGPHSHSVTGTAS